MPKRKLLADLDQCSGEKVRVADSGGPASNTNTRGLDVPRLAVVIGDPAGKYHSRFQDPAAAEMLRNMQSGMIPFADSDFNLDCRFVLLGAVVVRHRVQSMKELEASHSSQQRKFLLFYFHDAFLKHDGRQNTNTGPDTKHLVQYHAR